jgi:hypothetical protein
LLYVLNAGSGELVAVSVTTQPALIFGNPVNLPAMVTTRRLSTQMRAHDILPDGRFVGLVAASELPSPESQSFDREFRVVLNWHKELKRLVPTN